MSEQRPATTRQHRPAFAAATRAAGAWGWAARGMGSTLGAISWCLFMWVAEG